MIVPAVLVLLMAFFALVTTTEPSETFGDIGRSMFAVGFLTGVGVMLLGMAVAMRTKNGACGRQ